MYNWTEWQDHVTQFEDRYTESRNADGTITHTPVEGEVLQQGTPQSARNFNHMEDGISNAGELSALLAIEVIHQRQQYDREDGISNSGELAALLTVEMIHQRQQTQTLSGDVLEIELTNSVEYPFNNSVKTAALKRPRNNLDYTVTVEVLECSGGSVGDIEVTQKLVNGFKIEYTGSAKKAKLKVFVKGGFY